MKRREFLAYATASAAMAASSGSLALPAGGHPGLNALAKKRGLFFGTAVNNGELSDPLSVAAIRADCGLVTAQRAQKWQIMWPNRDRETPEEADQLAQFAERNNLLLRGHALVYDQKLPAWVYGLSKADMRSAFGRRIRYTASRWSGQVHSWDVVNEALEPNERNKNGLRDTIFLRTLGQDYISDAYFQAREFDQHALLCYNDYNLEFDESFSVRRRRAVLALIESLKKRGAPIGALGIQSHLKPHFAFDDKVWRDFLRQVAQLDVKILISELDVNDKELPLPLAVRDAEVAALTKRFLDVTLDEPEVIGVVTWGLTDRQSWMLGRQQQRDPMFTRTDGGIPRPLPLDASFKPKPMWHAIAAAFRGAPSR